MATPIVLALDFGEAPFPTADEPWCAPSDLTTCIPTPGALDVASVCAASSSLLRNLTGGRYGVRRQTVRPHQAVDGSGGWPMGVSPTPTGAILTSAGSTGYGFGGRGLDWPSAIELDGPATVLEVVVDGAYLPPSYADGVIVATQTGITSQHAGFTVADVGRSITGPGIPTGATITAVSSGVQATMSAVATATATTPFTIVGRTPGWYLYDRRMLVRSNGMLWPTQQDLTIPLSSSNTYAITYESGTAVPPEGKIACIALACDVGRLLLGSNTACTPPERVTSITRQGVSLSRLDPAEFIKEGLTGVRITDLWLGSLNARRKRRRASIAGPDNIRGART